MGFQDAIWLTRGPKLLDGHHAVPQQVLLYFITGNPGLIEYYRKYLTILTKEFASADSNILYHFVGFSLGGYELHGFQQESRLPLSLQEQVKHVEESISETAFELQSQQRTASDTKWWPIQKHLPVILVGHSVGAYIMLEIISRRQKWQREVQDPREAPFKLIGGICLFPTIIDIASSPSGRRVSVSVYDE
jgi:alpha-beta hydrolase superfamily lysophospholipase